MAKGKACGTGPGDYFDLHGTSNASICRTPMNSLKRLSHLFLAVTSICMCSSAFAGWTRDTRRDQKMEAFEPPRVDLSRYKSVQTRTGQNEDLALAVAISGGGHRAGNFAAGVLLALEDFRGTDGQPLNILREVDYFSTVSGGGFPVGVYLGTRSDEGSSASYSFQAALNSNGERYLKNLRRDYQMTLLEAAFTPECIGYKDAGDLLEEKFDNYLLGAKYRESGGSLVLSDVFREAASEKPVELPYWFANATVYENGTRFVFTPGIISAYGIKQCTHRMKDFEIHRDGRNMPLAVGMKTSASFPVLIPATTLKCSKTTDPLNPFLHLVDGGLVDNQGIYTAFEVLRQDPAKRKVLIVIDAFKGVSHPRSRWEASPSGPEMAVRIMKIALDSARTRLEQTLAQEQHVPGSGAGDGRIEVVLLSFSALKPETVRKYDDLEDEIKKIDKEKFKGFLRRTQREVDSVINEIGWNKDDGEDDAENLSGMALYEDARAVGTTLNITKAQQELLLKAGHEAVEQKRSFFEQHFPEENND